VLLATYYENETCEDEMGRACRTQEEKRSAYNILVSEPERETAKKT
jgi:hypothetical protein